MHNLLSRAQLDEWHYMEDSDDDVNVMLNDYYECLIECDSLNESACKRVCREILT